jgi:8-oxo-dGTP diphosphatase
MIYLPEDRPHLREIADAYFVAAGDEEEKITFVVALVYQGDKFIMGWNNLRRGWELPGGRVEDGESPLEAVMREVYEESGATITTARRIGSLKWKKIETGDIFTGAVFVAEAQEMDELPQDSEIMKINFFVEIPDQLSFSCDRVFYDDMLEWASKFREQIRNYKG